MRHTVKVLILLIIVYRFYNTQSPYHDGQQVAVKSCITEVPSIRNNKQSFRLEGIYVRTSDMERYYYGDYLQITGTLKRRLITPFLHDFYLLNQGIIKIQPSLLENSDQGIFHAFYSRLVYKILMLRENIQKIYASLFPAPQSQLLSGIILGSKEEFSVAFYNALKYSGTMHIVAASGMNLVLFIAPGLNILASLCGRRRAIVLIYFLIWFYVVLSGIQTSIVRAALMLSVLYLGQLFGRQSNSIKVLFITAVVMLLFKPLYIFDIGFWLSLSATAGLIIISPVITGRLEKNALYLNLQKYDFLDISRSFVETSSAYLATLPLISQYFHNINPLSLFPNILILRLVPYIMGIGAFLALVGLLFPSFVIIIGQMLWPPLSYMVLVISIFGDTFRTSFRFPNMGYFAMFIILLYYFVIYKIFVKSSLR